MKVIIVLQHLSLTLSDYLYGKMQLANWCRVFLQIKMILCNPIFDFINIETFFSTGLACMNNLLRKQDMLLHSHKFNLKRVQSYQR